LEERVVLNGGGGGLQGSPVLLQGLHAPARAFSPHKPASAASLVNLAYQQFQQDYTAVRATYFAAVQARTASANDYSTFLNYTQQRTNLLAQEVTNSLLTYSTSTSRGHGSQDPLPLVVLQINGGIDPRTRLRQTNAQSLYQNLYATTPNIDASATTIAIDTAAQNNAIQASNVATLNSVTVIRNGNYGNGSHKHHH
jgi:hypothetical protein